MQSRVIMLVDFDYFFAQIEERRNLSIKDKPVVICVYSGRSQDSGAVSTANYVARKYGVKSGMPIALAKSKLENVDAVFLPADYQFYEEVSEKTMTVLRGYADYFEQVGIDEAYLDVSRRANGSFEQAAELAQRIKNDIKIQCELTCSIGIGPNKLVAKIAADAQKPDGLTVVRPDQAESFLVPLPVDRLIGVGVKTKEKMELMAIRTIGDLARYDVGRLIEVFGRKLGTYFHNASMGIDDEPVQERGEAESISRIVTLKEDTRDLKVVLERTDGLCGEIYGEVRQKGLVFKSVGIIAVFTDMSVRSRSKTFENPANELETIKKTAGELFEKLLNESELKLRRVGIKVSNFVKEQKAQKQITSFFENSSLNRRRARMTPKNQDNEHKELPPNQTPIERLLRWGKDHPTVGVPVPKIDLRNWVLTVDGEVEKPLRLNWEEFLKLPQVESVSDFHCVEGWSVLKCRWEGVRFKSLIDLVKPRATAKSVTFECADGYTTSLTLEELSRDDVVLAYKLNENYLEDDIGAPVRLVVPSKYAYKSAMWITRIRFTSKKEMGYWEVRGYSDTADVWKNDRFSK